MSVKKRFYVGVAGGTGREAYENSRYSELVEKYGKQGADAMINDQLDAAKISPNQFATYREVKSKIQNGALDVDKAEEVAKQEVKDFVHTVLT